MLGATNLERFIPKEVCASILSGCERAASPKSFAFLEHGGRSYELEGKLASFKSLRSASGFFLMKQYYDECLEWARSIWGRSIGPSPHMLSRFFFESHTGFGDGHGWHAEKSTLTTYVALEDFSDPIQVIPVGAAKGKQPHESMAIEYTPAAGDAVFVAGRYIWVNFPPIKQFGGAGRRFLVMNFHDENDQSRQEGYDESLFNNQ